MPRKTLLSTVSLAIGLLSILTSVAQEPLKSEARQQTSLRVYFIGNCVTDTINGHPEWLQDIGGEVGRNETCVHRKRHRPKDKQEGGLP